MRAIDIIRQKRRFEMFSEKTKDKVLELNSFFGKYHMQFEDRIEKEFTYYDTPNQDLLKSNIVLFKTQVGTLTELVMTNDTISTKVRYTQRTHNRKCSKQIKPTDKLFKHKDFLIESFKNMFMSSVGFDPEFLLNKLQVAYSIKTESVEYRSMNTTGLKITYSFDSDVYLNNYNKEKVKGNILTIYQHSPEATNEDFEDLLSKLTRYLKELTPLNETKIMIARRVTANVRHPELEKKEQKKQAKLKAKALKEKRKAKIHALK